MKKPIRLFNLIGAAMLTIANFSLFAQSSQAAPQYQCVSRNGKYFTVANTPRGKVPIIEWVNSYGQYTKEIRCKEVSSRFQFFKESGQLKHLVTGNVNTNPVICAVSKLGKKCNSENVLFTLPPKSDPSNIARQLIPSLSNGRTLRLDGNDRIEVYQDDENYYNIDLILKHTTPINK